MDLVRCMMAEVDFGIGRIWVEGGFGEGVLRWVGGYVERICA